MFGAWHVVAVCVGVYVCVLIFDGYVVTFAVDLDTVV